MSSLVWLIHKSHLIQAIISIYFFVSERKKNILTDALEYIHTHHCIVNVVLNIDAETRIQLQGEEPGCWEAEHSY